MAPEDAIAHLHLGLALEAGGDPASAQRAFRVARRVIHEADHAHIEAAIEGYTADELLRMLDAKCDTPGRRP